MKRIFILLLILLIITGCSVGREIDQSNVYTSDLLDGTYKVSSQHYGSNGFKKILEISINKGIITDVKFTEVNKEGITRLNNSSSVLKWDNCEYNYSQILNQLYNETILTQGKTIDSITGATTTVNEYKLLLNKILSKAISGNTTDEVVDVFTDTYTLTNNVDPITGSQEILTVTYINGKMNSIVISEVTNNTAFYSIEKDYNLLAGQTLQQQNLESVVLPNIDQNTINRYNALISELKHMRN